MKHYQGNLILATWCQWGKDRELIKKRYKFTPSYYLLLLLGTADLVSLAVLWVHFPKEFATLSGEIWLEKTWCDFNEIVSKGLIFSCQASRNIMLSYFLSHNIAYWSISIYWEAYHIALGEKWRFKKKLAELVPAFGILFFNYKVYERRVS